MLRRPCTRAHERRQGVSRATAAGLLLALLAVLALTACLPRGQSGGNGGPTDPAAPAPDVVTGTPPVQLLRPGPGAPTFCTQLAKDPAIATLSDVVVATVDGRDRSAPARLRSAAESLRRYAAQGLGRPASEFAAGVDQIASNPTNDQAFDRLEPLGQALDAQMRTTCRTG